MMHYNNALTQTALQENVAIAAMQIVDADGRYVMSPLTLEQAQQIGMILYAMGYRMTDKEQRR